ncbi:MAG: hypothetical protein OZSIB_1872 [Candidatus Ozemobacter sibiricus]|uniref:Uncharacterized protein n=1 Tax=Candidatus Ozemobacter sibiricus TaxID=2268124 RepID=A0A367Z8U8_9BACT|nr:MAG: hypothetical protein OZSIB_1872 [Candidatus Ozemobacter sibiricus]
MGAGLARSNSHAGRPDRRRPPRPPSAWAPVVDNAARAPASAASARSAGRPAQVGETRSWRR